ncbi:MAG TPA: hypothetical protein VGL66_12950 [Caulobacteraceae bacterium]|jgi:hypothetical protein
MKTSIKAALLAMGFATLLAGAANSASAETVWQRHHPARVEVNHRLNHLHRRAVIERRDGVVGVHKARFIHREERGIRLQERRFASRHGGHLTRHEARRLNREENGVSRQVGR